MRLNNVNVKDKRKKNVCNKKKNVVSVPKGNA